MSLFCGKLREIFKNCAALQSRGGGGGGGERSFVVKFLERRYGKGPPRERRREGAHARGTDKRGRTKEPAKCTPGRIYRTISNSIRRLILDSSVGGWETGARIERVSR